MLLTIAVLGPSLTVVSRSRAPAFVVQCKKFVKRTPHPLSTGLPEIMLLRKAIPFRDHGKTSRIKGDIRGKYSLLWGSLYKERYPII